MDTLLVTLLSGSLGAIAGVLISIIYQNKHYKGNLVEKWISDLRNEVSNLLGLTEELRLQKKNDSSIGHLKNGKNSHVIVAKQQKIHMLLNDNKKQKELFESVKKVIELADNHTGSYVTYQREEDKLIEQTRLLLREEWHKISKFSWKIPMFLLFLFIAIPLLVHYNYDYLLCLIISLNK